MSGPLHEPSADGQGRPDRPVRIATRASDLALWQARWVAKRLAGIGLRSELVEVVSEGDRSQAPIAQLGVGVFVKAVQQAVLAGQADLAVHSHKDLPSRGEAGLALAAVPQRAAVHDVLLLRPAAHDPAAPVWPLKAGAAVGTSAARRTAQLLAARPDLRPLPLRGNVPSRVARLRDGAFDAVVLAAAGLDRLRLDLDGLLRLDLDPTRFVPAPAQGALALEVRAGDPLLPRLAALGDAGAQPAVEAERRLMAMLDAGCQLALGVHVAREPEGWAMHVWYQGRRFVVCHGAAAALPELAWRTIGERP